MLFYYFISQGGGVSLIPASVLNDLSVD